MSGFLGIGGSGAKADRSWQSLSAGGLNNLFNWGMSTGQGATSAGLGALGKAGSFFSSLLSGNRAQTNAAMAPQIATANAQTDAQRRQLAASGTARGGGTAPASQTAQTTKLAQIQNMLFGARTGAAEGLTKVGSAEGGIGLSAAATAGNAATGLGELGTNARKQDLAQQQEIGQSIGQIAASLLFA
jgi:hypothetical protein